MNYKLLGGVLLEGLLSFLSPCVLPLIPLYMSYLSGEDKEVDEAGNIHYKTGKVFITTLFFVLGICMTFLLLSLSLNVFKDFIDSYSEVISIIGGTLLIIFGLHQLGIIRIDVLNREAKPKLELGLDKMNFLKAFLLGFVFSLGWSPCIGPLLTNAILLASTESGGYLYLLAYALGLIIPFLITGLFTSAVLNFINKRKDIVVWTVRIAGIILIAYGSYMIYNSARTIAANRKVEEISVNPDASETEDKEDIGAYLYNLEIEDIKGNKVRLSDHKGKYIFLNFSTSWCPHCDSEMPDLIEFDRNEEVDCLVIMTPLNENNGISDIEKFAEDLKITIPVLIDESGTFYYYCGVNSYPRTFVISPEGKFIVYAPGAMNLEGFGNLLEYAKQNDNQ